MSDSETIEWLRGEKAKAEAEADRLREERRVADAKWKESVDAHFVKVRLQGTMLKDAIDGVAGQTRLIASQCASRCAEVEKFNTRMSNVERHVGIQNWFNRFVAMGFTAFLGWMGLK